MFSFCVCFCFCYIIYLYSNKNVDICWSIYTAIQITNAVSETIIRSGLNGASIDNFPTITELILAQFGATHTICASTISMVGALP